MTAADFDYTWQEIDRMLAGQPDLHETIQDIVDRYRNLRPEWDGSSRASKVIKQFEAVRRGAHKLDDAIADLTNQELLLLGEDVDDHQAGVRDIIRRAEDALLLFSKIPNPEIDKGGHAKDLPLVQMVLQLADLYADLPGKKLEASDEFVTLAGHCLTLAGDKRRSDSLNSKTVQRILNPT